MEALERHDPRQRASSRWIVLLVPIAALLLLKLSGNSKVAVYLDTLDELRLLYVVPVVAVVGVLVVLRYPRAFLYLFAVILPFNFVGGLWESTGVVIMAKVLVEVLFAATLLALLTVPRANYRWLTQTGLGVATLAWLACIAMGIVIGFLGADPPDWIRESSWMLFFVAVVPFAALVRDRQDVRRLLRATCASVAMLQVYAFWTVVNGRRFVRPDAWAGGQSFFRAPYSCQNTFVLYLAAAALFYYASARELSRRKAFLLVTSIALLGGGLLASMTRSLWLSAAVGLLVLLTQVRWDRRARRAALLLAAGAAVSVAVIVAVDQLSPFSNGEWLSSAGAFLADLGSKDSTSRVTRLIEWDNAIDVWRRSPFVGVGFGSPFAGIAAAAPDALVPDGRFYMHNTYLNLLAKIGIFGLGALLAVTWQALVAARRLGRREGADAFDKILAHTLVASIVQVSLLSLTMPVLTGGDEAAYFGLLLALTAVATVRPRVARTRVSG